MMHPIPFFSECPRSEDRMERFACPSPDFRGRYRCIDDRSLCDGFFDCPDREDENPDMCLFYKTVSMNYFALSSYEWKKGQIVLTLCFLDHFSDQGSSGHSGRSSSAMG